MAVQEGVVGEDDDAEKHDAGAGAVPVKGDFFDEAAEEDEGAGEPAEVRDPCLVEEEIGVGVRGGAYVRALFVVSTNACSGTFHLNGRDFSAEHAQGPYPEHGTLFQRRCDHNRIEAILRSGFGGGLFQVEHFGVGGIIGENDTADAFEWNRRSGSCGRGNPADLAEGAFESGRRRVDGGLAAEELELEFDDGGGVVEFVVEHDGVLLGEGFESCACSMAARALGEVISTRRRVR